MPMLFAIASLARAVTLLLEDIEQQQEMKARHFSSTAMLSQPVMKPVDVEKKREDEP